MLSGPLSKSKTMPITSRSILYVWCHLNVSSKSKSITTSGCISLSLPRLPKMPWSKLPWQGNLRSSLNRIQWVNFWLAVSFGQMAWQRCVFVLQTVCAMTGILINKLITCSWFMKSSVRHIITSVMSVHCLRLGIVGIYVCVVTYEWWTTLLDFKCSIGITQMVKCSFLENYKLCEGHTHL